MPALAELKHDMRDLALKAHGVVEDQELTGPEKREKLDKFDVDIKALAEQIKDVEYIDDKRKSLGDIIGQGAEDKTPEATETGAKVQAKSLGEHLTESEGFKSVQDAIKLGGRFNSGALELKATLSESGLTGSNFIVQDRQPGILPILFQRLTIADLMPSGSTNSNVVRYAKEGTATNAAAATAEAAAKPESALNFTVVDEPVRKIATTIKVSDEMLEDVSQMQSYINGRLVLFVRITEEAELLTGSGVAPHITGLLNRSGLTAAQAKGADNIAVAVHKEITKIRVASFLDPDSLVFNTSDWEKARFETDANGQFFGGGPFTGAYGVNGIPTGETYWGRRVVETTAETAGTVLVGAFQVGAQVFRRSGITVEMTNANEDDFKNNLVAVRAEERLALAVYRPSAFGTVTGL